jgi:spermidine synthase
MSEQTISRAKYAAVLACFFLSGAAGLVYQVAWGKALGLVFGHTVYAVATVIAVFMGGLAAGSAWLGRWSERHANPVALYGWIEVIIAAAGALSLGGLAGVRWLYLATYPAVEGSTAALVGLRFFASALVLLIPTFLMGGTLPILVRGVTRTSAELGARVSRLYWVNTAGAVAGTLAAGFLLLPALGLRLTVFMAVALNLLAGAIALWMSRGMSVQAEAAREEIEDLSLLSPDVAAVQQEPETGEGAAQQAETTGAPAGAQEATPWFLLGSFALVGATAIAYEVAWTRLLATMVGSSTYAFTLMLATFLAGIVIGSFLFEAFFTRREATLAAFAMTQTLTGLGALAFLIFFQQIPKLVPPILRATGESFNGLVLAQFATSALAMLPTAIIFGFNFPVVTVLIAGRPETSGRYAAAVGRAYAANTLGAIVGATATGFWLVPLLGSFRVVAFTGAANLLLAVLLQLRRAPRRTLALAANCILLGAAATAGARNTFYNASLANFGTVLYWDYFESNLTLEESAAMVDIVFVEDGLNATITVAQTDDYISLRTNGKVDASNNDLQTQLLSGHLGALFHPAPKRVLVIGFGSGMTVSAVAQHPEVERIDCVEIEPGVIHAAKYLESLNRGVLRDPRVRVILDDGRNFLLTTREKYDLIISEPSNPWIAGVATLFTEEFYGEVRARLNPGGMLVQWIQAYALFPEDVRMVLATVVPHFPQVSLWRGEEQDLLLLAQAEPRQLDLERLRKLWSVPVIRRDLETLRMRRPEALAAFHLLDDADVRRMVAGSPRNTDDHTQLEYRAPRALLADGLGDKNLHVVRGFRSQALPATLRVDNAEVLFLSAAETLIDLEEHSNAAYYVQQLRADSRLAETHVVRGRWPLARSFPREGQPALERALQLDPKSLEAAHGLAEIARQGADFDKAELLLRQILAREPKHVPALKSFVSLGRNRQNWAEAARWQQQLLAADPQAGATESARLGELLHRARQTDEGEAVLLRALARDPYNYVAHRYLGEIYRLSGRTEKALEHLRFVERYFPTTNSSLFPLLADAYTALGRPADAQAALRKGLRLFPADTEIQRRLAKN